MVKGLHIKNKGNNISGESAFGMEVVHGLSGLFVVRVDCGFHG